jgi:ketosteroid isomerase-like protein
MSQQNVEIVARVLGSLRTAMDAYSRNPEAMAEAIASGKPPPELQDSLALLAPAVEWHPPAEDPDTTRRIGSGAIIAYLMQWLDAWEYWRVEPESLLDAGDKVVVLTRSTGKGRTSGVELESLESAHLVTVEDGRIVRVQGFYDRDAALAAAGLN